MARRKTYTRTVYKKARGGYRARRGLFSGGNMNNLLIGAIAGFASPMIPNVLGKYTKPVVFGGAGYLLKKPALLTVAGYELGRGFSFGNGSTSNGGIFE